MRAPVGSLASLVLALALALAGCSAPAPEHRTDAVELARVDVAPLATSVAVRGRHGGWLLAHLTKPQAEGLARLRRAKGGLDPLVPRQVVQVLDRLGITVNGVWTAPSSGVANPATAELDMDENDIIGIVGLHGDTGDDMEILAANGASGLRGRHVTISSGTGHANAGAAATVKLNGGSAAGVAGTVDVTGATNVVGALTANGYAVPALVLDAAHGIAPVATNTYSGLGTRNGTPYQAFDVSTNETCNWPFTATTTTCTISVLCTSGTATTGNAMLEASLEDQESLDIDGESFGSVSTSSATACSATCGVPFRIAITVSDCDGMAAGHRMRLKLRRPTENASDTMLGDLQVLAITCSP